jgi:signal transduction histidine kinase
VRLVFEEQLSEFFVLMTQALLTGDPAWMNGILDQWLVARTHSEFDRESNSIPIILNQILLATSDTITSILDSKDGLELLGLILPIFSYATDYTTQKETDLYINHIAQELENAKVNLENLDRTKSDFIAVAAHELKTPLTLIEGYSSMIKDQLAKEEKNSQLWIYLSGMANGIHRLQEIVNDMIDVSMIDNNLLKLNFQPLWIRQLLDIAQNELNKHIRERSQRLTIIDFEGSNQMTYGDPERLYQALRNLLTNAIKFTPDGGEITVDGRKLPGFIEITISDTGIGIDEAYHGQIFEKFGRLGNVQLHSSGKTKYKGGGPGLGLTITKGLIEAHGGAIWLESEGYDEVNLPGTTFHILLPILQEPPDKKIAKLFQNLNDTSAEVMS